MGNIFGQKGINSPGLRLWDYWEEVVKGCSTFGGFKKNWREKPLWKVGPKGFTW